MGANTLCVSDTLCGRHLEITKFLRNITKNGIQHGQDDNVYCLLELMEKTKKKQSFLSLHQHAVLFPGRIFLVLVFLLILDLSFCCWWITSANPVSFLEGKFSFFFYFLSPGRKKYLYFFLGSATWQLSFWTLCLNRCNTMNWNKILLTARARERKTILPSQLHVLRRPASARGR